jgi:hypothetical protein
MLAMKTVGLLGLWLLLSSSLVSTQNAKTPSFSGTWTLNIQRSKLEAAHPPVSGETIILYDGKMWHFKRAHTNAAGKVDTWSIDLVIGSAEFHVEKDGPLVFRSRMYRDGEALVLAEDITASDGQKAKNTVRYTLEDNGNTLIESEKEETPAGNETNRWVLERKNVVAR